MALELVERASKIIEIIRVIAKALDPIKKRKISESREQSKKVLKDLRKESLDNDEISEGYLDSFFLFFCLLII